MSLTQPWVYENTSLAMQHILWKAFGLLHGSRTPIATILIRSLEDVVFIKFEERDSHDITEAQFKQFLAEDILDHTVRFLRDTSLASEVVGYRHPETYVRSKWLSIYKDICKLLHLNFETEGQFSARLGNSTQGKSIPHVKISKPSPERPIELDIDGFSKTPSIRETEPSSICTCEHVRNSHYQMAPESAPDIFECSGKGNGGEKCKCTKFVEKPKTVIPRSPILLPNSIIATSNPNPICAVCKHTVASHEVPNFSGVVRRCSVSNCFCTQFRLSS